MIGEFNYIVKNDDLGKLTKNVKDIDVNEDDDKCNQKNVEVGRLNRNHKFDFGGRKKNSFQITSRLWVCRLPKIAQMSEVCLHSLS